MNKVQEIVQETKKKLDSLKQKIGSVNAKGFNNNGFKVSKQSLITILSTIAIVVAHIAILFAIIASWRYYSIYPSLFGSIVAIVLCLLIIVDIIFFVGFNHSDIFLKAVSLIMIFFLLIGGVFGAYYINKINKTVNKVLDPSGAEYETFNGVFVCYKPNNYSSLSELSGKKVGLLTESSDGITSIATKALSKENVDYAAIDYSTTTALMQGLLSGEVDAIAINSSYRSFYENDENSDFKNYLDDLVDFNPFSEELKVNANKSTKNIATDPFNVLLIGYSRTDIGSPIGLADSIIVATINPQTYTVSMMSIARDSFVPIPCYGGERDKINSGRSTSRACFIETVEDFIGMEIDYWMELDYLGLVAIVNEIGGIYINNPVEFELDGIYVPAGEKVFADGQMALQFSRERHHMPNGDFDRQQHQKEVIIAIAKKFIESGSVSLALRAMEVASGDGDEESRFLWTNFTLNQLTSVFNLLLNTKNYTSLETFDLVDFQTLRMTGNGGLLYYSYSMRLPLWVYLIYQQSYDESVEHINEILGNYKKINQDKNFEFSNKNPYVRSPFYSLDYDNNYMFTPDPMPAYWPMLDEMSVSEALAWASSVGVNLSVNLIDATDPSYDANLEGRVISQSVRYGSLVSDYRSGSITAMGSSEVDESQLVPDMSGWKISKAKDWAAQNGVQWAGSNPSSGRITSQSCDPGSMISGCPILSVQAKEEEESETVTIKGKASPSEGGTVRGAGQYEIGENVTLIAEANDGYKFVKWKETEDTKKSISFVAEENETYTAIFEKTGGGEQEHEHEWGDWKTTKEASCESGGEETRKCKKCDETETRPTEPLGHLWEEVGRDEATCDAPGHIDYKCSRCDKTASEPIPQKTEGCGGGDDEGGGSDDGGGDSDGDGGDQGGDQGGEG